MEYGIPPTRLSIQHQLVEIGARLLDGRLHCWVQDTGIGIDAANRERVFQPFVQTDSSTTRLYGGTGLGLSMVHGFVTQTGGEISVTSTPGAGTSFKLAFPLVHGEQSKTKEERSNRLGTTNGARVLLVDDDEFVRDALALSLRDKGYPVVVAPDGQSALTSYGDGVGFDVVIADVVLTPAMSGPDLDRKSTRLNSSHQI